MYIIDVPASGAYFFAYEIVMRKASEKSGRDQVSLWWSIFAGGCAGIANWVVGMPADVLKSRYQTGEYYFVFWTCTLTYLHDWLFIYCSTC